MYSDIGLFINGEWLRGNGRTEQDIINPATAGVVGRLTHARPSDLASEAQWSEKPG